MKVQLLVSRTQEGVLENLSTLRLIQKSQTLTTNYISITIKAAPRASTIWRPSRRGATPTHCIFYKIKILWIRHSPQNGSKQTSLLAFRTGQCPELFSPCWLWFHRQIIFKAADSQSPMWILKTDLILTFCLLEFNCG